MTKQDHRDLELNQLKMVHPSVKVDIKTNFVEASNYVKILDFPKPNFLFMKLSLGIFFSDKVNTFHP